MKLIKLTNNLLNVLFCRLSEGPHCVFCTYIKNGETQKNMNCNQIKILHTLLHVRTLLVIIT